MTGTRPVRYRANPLFWIVGIAIVVIGLAIMAVGVMATINCYQQPDPLQGDGLSKIADATLRVAQGGVIMTIGRYIFRGARRRGARDRFGRLLIIAGHILVGIAFTEAVPIIGRLRLSTSQGQAESISNDFIITFACWALPGAILALIGTRMAHEEQLMDASAGV